MNSFMKNTKIGMKLSIGNSIYAKGFNDGSNGLTVKNGMLINNRPDDRTGIAKAADLNREMKRARKVEAHTEAIINADNIKKMSESCSCGGSMGSCSHCGGSMY
jgi:hypothetical protein